MIINIDGYKTTDPSEITTAFCNFFANITTEYRSSTATGQPDFVKVEKLLKEKLNGIPQFIIPMVTVEFVMKQFSSLKSDTSTGFDNLRAEVLKCSAHVISAPITKIINLSITMPLFTSRWKCARATPIFKGGSPTDMNCYRPKHS